MSEEIANANVIVPRSIMLSVLINGSLGFGMLLATLFCLGSIQKALSTPTGFPFLQIFLGATDSVGGTATMGAIVTTMGICTSVGMLAASSRQVWAFSRDMGVPGWRVWSRVTSDKAVPVFAVGLTATVACLLALIIIGSPVAFNSLVSMSISGLYLSYLVVSTMLLYRRCTGGISRSNGEDEIVNTAGAKLVWGPFHIPGIFGILVNAYAVVYMIVIVFFTFWPTSIHITYKTMNYSVVGTFGTVILSIIYYVVRARKVYEGPVIEVDSM
jgi:amino acid transporter